MKASDLTYVRFRRLGINVPCLVEFVVDRIHSIGLRGGKEIIAAVCGLMIRSGRNENFAMEVQKNSAWSSAITVWISYP